MAAAARLSSRRRAGQPGCRAAGPTPAAPRAPAARDLKGRPAAAAPAAVGAREARVCARPGPLPAAWLPLRPPRPEGAALSRGRGPGRGAGGRGAGSRRGRGRGGATCHPRALAAVSRVRNGRPGDPGGTGRARPRGGGARAGSGRLAAGSGRSAGTFPEGSAARGPGCARRSRARAPRPLHPWARRRVARVRVQTWLSNWGPRQPLRPSDGACPVRGHLTPGSPALLNCVPTASASNASPPSPPPRDAGRCAPLTDSTPLFRRSAFDLPP